MSSLPDALGEYLTIRRALGYKLEQDGKLLAQFVAYLEQQQTNTVTTEHAVAWATLPAGASAAWWANRLTVVRGFAAYLQTLDRVHEVPPARLLPTGSRRATPYLYSDEEIAALISATTKLRFHRLGSATYRTLIGLLAVSGLRIGEALRLDRGDIDDDRDLLIVRNSKYGKTRQVPLHPSTTRALHDYLRQVDRVHPQPNTPAVFISTAGTRLMYRCVNRTFRRLVRQAGLAPRSGSCRPRVHDLRHTFAVRAVLDAYQSGADVGARLALLSTYLGHVDPTKTYWYLSAAPELLALAGARLEHYLGRPR
jgi:integrase/recombinase XerD